MTPFFSVIIPAYNRAHVLKRAIDSVLAQTCQDFEIVVVDDGSRDDPRAVIQAFADPRIRFVRQDNQGAGVARNTAIDHAAGRFIAPLDSDDVFLPHHLSAMKAVLEGSTDMAAYAQVITDRGGGKTVLKPPRAIRAGEDMGEYLLADRGFVPTITVVVPRHAARTVRYDTELRPAQDVDFAMRLSRAGIDFRMAEQPGAIWHDSPDPRRVSATTGSLYFRAWLAEMRPHMTPRAYHGARGWALAKLVAGESGRLAALPLTLGAVLRGCYGPRLAFTVLLQVLLTPGQYRALSDTIIGLRTRA